MRKMSRRSFIRGLAVGGSTACAMSSILSSIAAGQAEESVEEIYLPLIARPPGRPNILLIVTDDQRWDTMQYMPCTTRRIFDEGVSFTNAYVTTPRCGPSRASILTGMYAHSSGARTNQDPLTVDTFVHHLHSSGYRTAMIGKYLNSWTSEPRPEFDRWVSYARRPQTYNPDINVDGIWIKHKGHEVELFRDYALQFLDDATTEDDRPFFMHFAPHAPHAGAKPVGDDATLYEDLPPHRPPSFNESNMEDNAEWLRSLDPLSTEDIAVLDEFRLTQIRSLTSLDRAIDALLDKLDKQGVLENTAIMFISDNGVFWGEHRLRGKRYPYEEASKVPFALRYPVLTPKGNQIDRLVANIDIAPTIYTLAGLPVPANADGKSLTPLVNGSTITGEAEWREHLLLEGWREPASQVFANGPGYKALRFDQYLYIEYVNDKAELYDLDKDPFQLQNQASTGSYAGVVQKAIAIMHSEYRSSLSSPTFTNATAA